jgi:hypothetical protein
MGHPLQGVGAVDADEVAVPDDDDDDDDDDLGRLLAALPE